MLGALSPRSLFKGLLPQQPFIEKRLLSREERLSRGEELNKDLAERGRLHEEEAAAQFPLSLPSMPPT
jgi:hypothetical protein